MENLTLKEIQFAEFKILEEFDRICNDNNLRYSLAGGTLLGAVRHKGFVPWDDDIDVCMPRPDYEKFKKIFKNEQFYLSDDKGKYSIYPFLKMMDKSIEVQEVGFNEVSNLWIDVFPIDGLPSENKKLKKIYKKSSLYRKIIVFDKWKNLNVYGGKHNKLIAFLIKIYVKTYGVKRAIKNSIRLALKHDYKKSDYVGAITWGCYGVGERMLKSEYEQFTEMEFEGKKFSVMGCWDSYLRGIYGDYMKLPPEDKRITHGIKAFRAGDEI